MRLPVSLSLPLVLLVTGCGTERGRDAGRRPPEPSSAPSPDAGPRVEAPPPWLEELLDAEDSRDLPRLEASAKSPVATIRSLAIRAVGRAQVEAAIPTLLRALGDESAEVAAEAAFGLGLLGDLATPAVEEALLGKLAGEAGREGRSALCDALGRVGGDRSVAALVQSLEDSEESVRVAAAEGLGRFVMRKKPLTPEAVRALARRIQTDGSPGVRAAAAFAFTRAPASVFASGDAGTAARRALEGAVTDAEADVRIMAIRALGPAQPLAQADPVATAAAEDPDWRVRVNALKSLVARAKNPGPALAAHLAREVRAFASDRDAWGGTQVHVLATALELAATLPANAALSRVLEEALTTASPNDPPEEARRALDLLACGAAFALDRAAGRPRRVLSCGSGAAEWRRQVLEAQVLGSGRGPAKARAQALSKKLASDDRRVRVAVLDALGGIDDDGARAALLAALEGEDLAEVATAADGLARQAKKLVQVDPGAAEEAKKLGVSINRREAPLTRPDPAVAAKLAKALRRFSGANAVEAALSLVGAIEALGSPDGQGVLREMLSHPNHELRTKATKALRSLGAAIPSPLPSPVAAPNPVDAAAAARLVGRSPRATIRTSRGEIEIELFGDDAPATVLNFIRLARSDAYDATTFHRVVPNFVVQGGDPRGDGYGGPGWSIRCELNRRRYERGAVGMALAGKDTGGSQFFVTHSPQPHLDGRYTVFGRVTRGQDVVDVIEPGDVIEDVTIADD